MLNEELEFDLILNNKIINIKKTGVFNSGLFFNLIFFLFRIQHSEFRILEV